MGMVGWQGKSPWPQVANRWIKECYLGKCFCYLNLFYHGCYNHLFDSRAESTIQGSWLDLELASFVGQKAPAKRLCKMQPHQKYMYMCMYIQMSEIS